MTEKGEWIEGGDQAGQSLNKPPGVVSSGGDFLFDTILSEHSNSRSSYFAGLAISSQEIMLMRRKKRIAKGEI